MYSNAKKNISKFQWKLSRMFLRSRIDDLEMTKMNLLKHCIREIFPNFHYPLLFQKSMKNLSQTSPGFLGNFSANTFGTRIKISSVNISKTSTWNYSTNFSGNLTASSSGISSVGSYKIFSGVLLGINLTVPLQIPP